MKENEQIEFKKTTAELNTSMDDISAILNKHGEGTLYFGLKNDGTPVKFQINDSTLRDVSRKISEAIKPQIFPEIELIKIDNCDIIKVSFKGDDKPYSSFGKYYMRTSDETRELVPYALRKIMIEKEYEDNWEDKISIDEINDVDILSLDRFRRKSYSCGRLDSVEYTNVELLEKLNLLVGRKLTNAGRMLFSKNKPIVLKLAVFATCEKNTFLDIERFEGNIFELIDKSMKYLKKNLRWKALLGSDAIERVEIPEIPLEALREVIVNSFAHAQYNLPIQHEIAIFSNRVEITNPGSFANKFEPTDFFTSNISSHLRNKTIAKVLYLCKDVESFGTGLSKIYKLCKKNKNEVKYFKHDDFFRFVFSRIDRNLFENESQNESQSGPQKINEPQNDSQSEPQKANEPQNEPQNESQSEPQKANEPQNESQSGPQKINEPQNESQSEPQKINEPQNESQSGPQKINEPQNESQSEPQKANEPQNESQSEPQNESQSEPQKINEPQNESQSGPQKINEPQNESQSEPQKINESQKFDEIERDILNLIIGNRFITRKEISMQLGKSKATIARIIKRSKVIVYEGSSKKGYWKIIQK